MRVWIEMFNAGGIDALTTKGRPGRRRRVKIGTLTRSLSASLGESAPSWRASLDGQKIHGFLKDYLHELSYKSAGASPLARTPNDAQCNSFLDQLRTWQADAGLELWFADECGVEGDPPAAALERSGRAA